MEIVQRTGKPLQSYCQPIRQPRTCIAGASPHADSKHSQGCGNLCIVMLREAQKDDSGKSQMISVVKQLIYYKLKEMKEKQTVPQSAVMQVLRVQRRTQLRLNKTQGVTLLPQRDPSIRALIVCVTQLEGYTLESVYAEFHGMYGGYDMLQCSVAIQEIKKRNYQRKSQWCP